MQSLAIQGVRRTAPSQVYASSPLPTIIRLVAAAAALHLLVRVVRGEPLTLFRISCWAGTAVVGLFASRLLAIPNQQTPRSPLLVAIQADDAAQVQARIAGVKYPPIQANLTPRQVDIMTLWTETQALQSERELLTLLWQSSDLKTAVEAHSWRVLPLVTPDWLKLRWNLGSPASYAILYALMTSVAYCGGPHDYSREKMSEVSQRLRPPQEMIEQLPPCFAFKAGLEREGIQDPKIWSARSVEYLQNWLGSIQRGQWSNHAFYDSWYGRLVLQQLMAICGFAHPKDVEAVGSQLESLGVTKAVDPCAGRGFLSAQLTHFAGLDVQAFDIAYNPHYDAEAIYYPVVRQTDALTLDYTAFDWSTTVLVLSWPDDAGSERSYRIILKALDAGMQTLLIVSERIAAALHPLTAQLLVDRFDLLQKHLLHQGGYPHGAYMTLELLRLKL